MQNKKAQIQIGESLLILFIFFILLIFGFVFYMNVIKSSSKAEMEENIQLKAIGIAQKASFLPELQCSNENVRRESCIDLLKLSAAADLLDESYLYYYDVFEFSKIWVTQIFPEAGEELFLYNNPLTNWTNNITTFIPVSLFNETAGEYGFGILAVEVYIR